MNKPTETHYTLEILFAAEGMAVREDAKHLTTDQVRRIIAVFEEYKLKLLDYIMFLQKQEEIKDKEQAD